MKIIITEQQYQRLINGKMNIKEDYDYPSFYDDETNNDGEADYAEIAVTFSKKDGSKNLDEEINVFDGEEIGEWKCNGFNYDGSEFVFSLFETRIELSNIQDEDSVTLDDVSDAWLENNENKLNFLIKTLRINPDEWNINVECIQYENILVYDEDFYKS